MAYDGTKLNCLIASRGAGGPQLFHYMHSDARATVEGASYFSDGISRGMKVGDLVAVVYTTGYVTTIHAVASVTATAATINAAVLA